MFFGYLVIPSFPFKKFFDSFINGRRYSGGWKLTRRGFEKGMVYVEWISGNEITVASSRLQQRPQVASRVVLTPRNLSSRKEPVLQNLSNIG